MRNTAETTRWLARLAHGEEGALEEVIRLLYDEVRSVARQKLRGERDGHTLNATALVNEIYVKLAHENRIEADSRTRFLAVAAKTMRRVLIDFARTRKRQKRGGGQLPHSLDQAGALSDSTLTESEADEIIALEDALERLMARNSRAAEIVEQRFFAGLSLDEVANLLDVSVKTVQREWTVARAWLKKEIQRDIEAR